jgi:hypothetical protein
MLHGQTANVLRHPALNGLITSNYNGLLRHEQHTSDTAGLLHHDQHTMVLLLQATVPQQAHLVPDAPA